MSSFDILSKAVPLQRRLFLEASAGTGKTFTIEHLVIRLLLETDYTLDQILVVTFTRAATRELKVRIRANLEKALSLEHKEKLKNALLTFEKAQIFTIHGFCHRILQEFAFEASISVDLQEWEDKEEKWAILEFLRSTTALSPAQLQRVLGFVRGDIDTLVNKLLKAPEAKGFSSLELLRQANSNLSCIAPFSVTQAFDLARPHYKGMTSSDFDKQAALLDLALQRKEILSEEWDRLIAEEEIFLEGIEAGNLKARTKFTGHAPLEQLKSAVLPSLEAARNPRQIFQVLSGAWHEEKKKLSRLYERVSPDDLLKMVQEKLTEKSFVSEIRKKYQAVIVDEFQDTDPIQWKIFETLFLADPTKAVYLVGDPKQSIYAFRSADIYTFLDAAKRFEIEEKAALTTNYRCTQGLLDELNRLFCTKPWMDLPKLNQQLSVPLSTAAKQGEGELCFMIADGELGMGKRWPSEAVEHQFFSYIIHQIHQHQLRPQEIAILVKDRYQALRVKNALEKYQVPCVISRGASLGDSIMIDLLLELVEACQGTLSSVKKVLLGPFVQLPIEELTDEAVFQAKAVFAELSLVWLESGFSVFLAQFLQTKFWKRSVFQTLSLALYDDLMQVVEKILYLRDPHQLSKALELLKIEEVDERISAHPHGVQIMTIHASKGLEFETVFALGLASRTPAEEKPEEELKELDAEKMRQFYVALTRAKKRLYIPVAQAGKPAKLGEASPVELFLERTSPDLETFTHVYLNQIVFDLLPYAASAPFLLVPPPSSHHFFKPFFLQSFTSLAQTSGERKTVSDPSLPSSAETGIIIHRILERFFDQKLDLRELIDQEVKGSHLETYGDVIQTMIDKVLDLQLVPDHKNLCQDLRPDFSAGHSAERAGIFEQAVKRERTAQRDKDGPKIGKDFCGQALDGFCLRDLERTRVMPEMEFLFPSEGTALKGFIDLSFEHNGKFYLIDWKTNVLEDYTPESLYKAMFEHDYLLQGKIYATAFTRYLKLYGSHCFGGAFFLFVRGPAAYHFIPEVLDV